MAERMDIYGDRTQIYEVECRQLYDSATSPRNKVLIAQWHNHLFARGSGTLRVAKVSSQLRKIALHLGKDLDQVTKADIEALVGLFNRTGGWSAATKADYRRCLKQFYGWFRDEDLRLKGGDPDAQAFYRYLDKQVQTTYREEAYDYSEIINDEDLHKVLSQGCSSVKEKAFLAVLHEGGFRIDEHLNVRRKDLEFKENCVLVQVDGKTGMRRVPLIQCMGYLARWLDEHPFPNDPQAFVWTGNNSCFMHEPIHYVGAVKLIRRCFERAKIGKQHNPHWFRHSRATLNAPDMTEVMLCKFFGWELGSRQVRRYVHSNVGQIEDAVLRMNGLQKREEQRPIAQKCACGMMNDALSRYCHRCGKPLSAAVVLHDENTQTMVIDETFEMLQRIMADPVLRVQFENWRSNPQSFRS